MTGRVIRSGPNDPTRHRILTAAILRFSTQSYEETGLRQIAADVGVDMAYVHRSFGSKENLFYESFRAVLQTEGFFVKDTDDLPASIARDLLSEKARDVVRPLDILTRSLSSPDANGVLQRVVNEDFIAALLSKCEGLSEQRAALVAALLAGVGILRNVIRIDALLADREGGLEHLITRLIAELLDAGNTPSVKTRDEA